MANEAAQKTRDNREEKAVRRRGYEPKRLGKRKFKLKAYCGVTETGKRVYFSQVYHGTSDGANARLREILEDISNGRMPTRTLPEPEREVAPVLVSEVLERWLKHKSNSHKARPRTVSNYQWLLNAYVVPTLGSKAIAEVSESDIQDCYNGLVERGISAKTIRNLHKVVEPALQRAVGWGEITKNPAEHVELPVWHREEARYLTEEQVHSFLALAKSDRYYAGFVLAIEIGPRPNEWLALRWSDIDFDNQSVTIRRSLYWPKGGSYVFTHPKTQRSNRTITVSAQVIEALRQHRSLQLNERLQAKDYADEGLVFATATGGAVCWRNLTRRHFKPLLTAAGIS